MAHFRGTLQGNRGETSRLGTKNSGLTAEINGWNIGVKVELFHKDGKDKIRLTRTGGSNSKENGIILTEYEEE